MSEPATTKKMSDLSFENVLRQASNDQTGTIGVGGFITAKIGHRITLAIGTTNVANDTETYTYFDNSTQLLQLQLIYTDGTRGTLVSVERIA
jgi:hypothetical protein